MALENIDSIVLVIITGTMTILASLLTQIVVNRQKRNDYLKEKTWDNLLQLVESISQTQDRFKILYEEHERSDYYLPCIEDNLEVMKTSQPYIYMTGKRSLITAFSDLHETISGLQAHLDNECYNQDYNNYVAKLLPQCDAVVQEVSEFMRS